MVRRGRTFFLFFSFFFPFLPLLFSFPLPLSPAKLPAVLFCPYEFFFFYPCTRCTLRRTQPASRGLRRKTPRRLSRKERSRVGETISSYLVILFFLFSPFLFFTSLFFHLVSPPSPRFMGREKKEGVGRERRRKKKKEKRNGKAQKKKKRFFPPNMVESPTRRA